MFACVSELFTQIMYLILFFMVHKLYSLSASAVTVWIASFKTYWFSLLSLCNTIFRDERISSTIEVGCEYYHANAGVERFQFYTVRSWEICVYCNRAQCFVKFVNTSSLFLYAKQYENGIGRWMCIYGRDEKCQNLLFYATMAVSVFH